MGYSIATVEEASKTGLKKNKIRKDTTAIVLVVRNGSLVCMVI